MQGSSLFLYVSGLTRFKAPVFTPDQVVAIGGFAIEAMQKRLDACQNLLDQPAKPYSTHGPIYVPISGVGTFTPKGALSGLRVKRNKTTLGGREVFTHRDVQKIKSSPGIIYIEKGSTATPQAGKIVVKRTRKSLKFANYSEYKKALGKSGLRDLQLSGRMRGAIMIVKQTGSSVDIGFSREEEHLKAQGNQKLEPWFGLSPNDRTVVMDQVRDMLPEVVKNMK
jgi:hypothetical protein